MIFWNRYRINIDLVLLSYNNILQYWLYGISIKILTANQQEWKQGFAKQSKNFNAGFIKPTSYNIFFYILSNVLIDAIKPNAEKISKFALFLRDCLGEDVWSVKKASFVSFRVHMRPLFCSMILNFNLDLRSYGQLLSLFLLCLKSMI